MLTWLKLHRKKALRFRTSIGLSKTMVFLSEMGEIQLGAISSSNSSASTCCLALLLLIAHRNAWLSGVFPALAAQAAFQIWYWNTEQVTHVKIAKRAWLLRPKTSNKYTKAPSLLQFVLLESHTAAWSPALSLLPSKISRRSKENNRIREKKRISSVPWHFVFFGSKYSEQHEC